MLHSFPLLDLNDHGSALRTTDLDLDDHGSALRAATSVMWNGTGERSGDPMGPYRCGELRRRAVPASQIALQLGPKLQPGEIL